MSQNKTIKDEINKMATLSRNAITVNLGVTSKYLTNLLVLHGNYTEKHTDDRTIFFSNIRHVSNAYWFVSFPISTNCQLHDPKIEGPRGWTGPHQRWMDNGWFS